MGSGAVWLGFAMVNFSLFGAALARRFGRNPWGWGILCLLLALPGIGILCIAGRTQGAKDAKRDDADSWRWSALKLVDEDIRAAAETAATVNREHLLSQVYLAAGDRKYLDAALRFALDDAAAAKAARESRRGQRKYSNQIANAQS
nr:conserved hypothetical protein [Rhizobiaceae bacterium]